MRLLKFSNAHQGPERLQTERLMLRRPQVEDFEAWAQLRGESAAFLQPFEPSWASNELARSAWRFRMRRMEAEIKSGRALPYFLFLRNAPDVLVGGLTISNIRRRIAESGSLGYWMGQRYANKGYMSEAVNAASERAFSNHGLHRIEAATILTNDASRAVLLKCGYRHEGVARAYLRIAGQWQDHDLYARLAEDRA